MLTLSRKLIATVSAATLLGLFSTTVVPTITSDAAVAHAAAKKKTKKTKKKKTKKRKKSTVRSHQS